MPLPKIAIRVLYEVLYLQPDRQTGCTVPNLRFTWTGFHWAALSFSVPTMRRTPPASATSNARSSPRLA